MAFAARYGKTGPNVSLHMPSPDLASFINALAKLIEEEREAAKNPT